MKCEFEGAPIRVKLDNATMNFLNIERSEEIK